MQRVTSRSFLMPEIADEIESAHTNNDVEHVNLRKLAHHVRKSVEIGEDANVDFTNTKPTDNAGRPKSVLMSDVKTGENEYVLELLCTEKTEVNEENMTYKDDGKIEFPVSQVGKPTYRYDLLEMVIYKRQ